MTKSTKSTQVDKIEESTTLMLSIIIDGIHKIDHYLLYRLKLTKSTIMNANDEIADDRQTRENQLNRNKIEKSFTISLRIFDSSENISQGNRGQGLKTSV